ncbi:MAG: tRNA 2-thiouridine(34) synthase MnmA [Chloroflexi bacterium]|nr:tRNA 2-thiouridine(34) synthase MnmA [Chloroflexota bacterium]
MDFDTSRLAAPYLDTAQPRPAGTGGKGRVVVAMSGGVDSSVAALLLAQQGYEVIGITMRLWTLDRDDLPAPHRTCCSVEAVDDAQRVCQKVGIPWYLMNFEQPFKAGVVDYFVEEYARGRTPHPCVACNQHVKFATLLDRALALGADSLATGHYARVAYDGGRYRLLRAVDPAKDQSYVLYGLGQEQLRRVLLPVGHYSKPDIRRLALDAGLPVADKPDSQEICFIPDNDYRRFLSERLAAQPGPIVDRAGNVLGTHRGIPYYTVGQRQGMGLATGQRLYVLEIDRERNTVVVGPEEGLYAVGLVAETVTFVSGAAPREPAPVTAKIRYKSALVEGTLLPGAGGWEVRFAEPQRAVTPGQPVVWYDGDEVLGGGIISAPIRSWDRGEPPRSVVRAGSAARPAREGESNR